MFNLTTAALGPRQARHITRRHTFAQVSVRRLYPGPHGIDIQANGRVLASIEVVLSGS